MIPKQPTNTIITGKDLLLMIEQGDRDVFTNFYLDNFRKLILVADKYVQSIPVAEEIVQDIFLKIWEDQQALTGIHSIKSYLYRSVVNSAINYVNRQKNIEKHHLKIADHIMLDDIESRDDHNALIVLLYDEIELLPDKCKQVFKLSRLEGVKYRDIAVQLNISEKTVESHMGHALKTLRVRVLHQAIQNNDKRGINYLSVFALYLY